MKSTKRTTKVIFFISIAIFLGLGNKTASAVNLEYCIVIDDPASHGLRIQMVVKNLVHNILWIARPVNCLSILPSISGLSVTDAEGHDLNFTIHTPAKYGGVENEKISIISNGTRTVLVEYTVDLTPNDNSPYWKLDYDYGVVESQIVFYQPINVKVDNAEAEFFMPQGWKVVSRFNSLNNQYQINSNDTVVFGWEEIEYFIWGPIAFGDFSVHEQLIKNTNVKIAFYGNESIQKTVANNLFSIIQYGQNTIGELTKSPSLNIIYVFIPSLNSPPYNISSRDHILGDFRTLSDDPSHDRYFLSRYRELVHTIFHTFFSHYDFDLWDTTFFGGFVEEGIIQFFALKSLSQTGVLGKSQINFELNSWYGDYSKYILNTIYDVPIYPVNNYDSLPNDPLESYYTYGIQGIIGYEKAPLVLWMLDHRIKEVTFGTKNLGDIFKYFHDNNPGSRHQNLSLDVDLLNACNLVTGHDFANFFRMYITGNDPLPGPEFLKNSIPFLPLLLLDN